MFDFNSLPKNKKHLRKVQLGAGNSNSKEFINIDAFQTDTADIICDITERLPFDDNTIEEFYSHHVLEHLTVKELDGLLDDIYRCLKPGGKFISVLPDFEKAAMQFIRGENLYNATGSIWGCATLGWKPREAHIHMYGWTKNSLTKKLQEHNFTIISMCQKGEQITTLSFIAKKG